VRSYFTGLLALRATHSRPVGPLARAVAFAVVALMCLGNNAWAVSATWDADADAQWATGTAWVGGTAAGSASAGVNTDTATFDGAGNYVVGLNGGSVQRHIGTIDITNTGTTTFNNGGYLYVYDTIKMSATAGAVNIGGNLRLNGTTANTITNDNTASLLTISAATGRSVAGSATVTVGGAGSTTITGAITPASGSLAFTKVGTGALTLAGNNNFAGGVTLKQGTINISTNNSALGTGTFQIGDSTGTTAVTVDSLSARSITNALSLYQDFTYTGTNTLSQGTGAITLATNGTTGNRAITVSASTLTLGGNIGDGGGGYSITKNGAGTLVLSGTSNTYGGGTTISNGVLTIATTGALPGWDTNGRFSVVSGATLAVYNAVTDTDITTMLGTTNFAAGSSIGFDTTTAGRTYSVSLANTAQGALGLTKLGTNTLTLSGTASTYTGATTINSGSLQIDNAGSLGNTSGITVSASNNSALVLNNVTAGSGKALTIRGPGVGGFYGALTTPTTGNTVSEWQGSVTIGTTTLTRIGSQTGTLKVSGNIGETTSGSELIVRNNGGVTVLSGANTFSGSLSISTGTLRVGGDTNIDGSNNIISGPLGKGSLVAAVSSAALTAEGSTARTIYNPVTFTSNNPLAIGAATTDTGKLTFRGAFTRTGTNIVSINSDVDFAGGSTSSTLNRVDVNGGTTTVSSGTYNLNNYLTLNTSGTTAAYVQTGGSVTVTSGGIYAANRNDAISTITVSGGELISSVANGLRFGAYTGGSGIYTVSGGGSMTSTITGGSGLYFDKTSGTAQFNLGDGTNFTGGTSINDGGTSGTLTVNKITRNAGSGVFNFNGGTLKASENNATFLGDNTNITANVMAGGGIIDNNTFNISIGQNLLNGGGTDGGMVFKGSGTTTLTGTSTYNGGTTINAGTLNVNSAAALGDSSGYLTFNGSGATLQLGATIASTTRNYIMTTAGTIDTNSYDLTHSGTISGAGTLTKSGTGTLTLGNTNTYSGGTTVNAGTLTIGTGGTLGATTGALAVNNPNTGAGTAVVLNLATAVDTTVGSLSGTKATPSSGTNTSTINNGGSGRNFIVNQTADGTYDGVIAGAGSFTLGSLSTNKLTLTGANTYSGTTTISAGTLAANAANALGGTMTVTVTGGSLLIGANEAINNDAEVVLSGTGSSIVMGDGGSAMTQHVGALTLNANSTLDFGTNAGGNTLWFTGTFTGTSGQLTVGSNWTYGTDHLVFTSDPTANLSYFTFSNGFVPSVQSYSTGFEIIAIPEPGTILAGALLLGGLFFFERKRIKRLLAGASRVTGDA